MKGDITMSDKKELNEKQLEQVNGGSGDNPCYNNNYFFPTGNCDKCGLYSSCKNPNKPSLMKYQED